LFIILKQNTSTQINRDSLAMFEAILFDMDGLFIDSEPDWHAAETEMMRGYGYDWKLADQLQCLGGPLSRVTEYMSDCLNGAVEPTVLGQEIISEMQVRLGSATSYMPGAIEFSKLVHDMSIPQALVSASPRVLVDAVVGNLSQNYFKVTVASGDIPRTKPFPDPYIHAAQLLGVDISKCLIFEDSQTGITAATASGAFVVAIPHYIQVDESARLKRIESFRGLSMKDLTTWWNINQHERDKSL
jgi:HAD superfamily hydrolase (TIGR01509 family)